MSSGYECVLQAHLFTHKQLCIQISKNRGRNHISSRAYLQKKDWTCAIFFRTLLIFFCRGWGYTSYTLTTDQLQPASYNIGFQRTGLQYMVLTLGGHCSRTTAVSASAARNNWTLISSFKRLDGDIPISPLKVR